MAITRRRFIALVGAVATATGLPQEVVAAELMRADSEAAVAAARLTTLAQTLRQGTGNDLGYAPVALGDGEPHLVRDELTTPQANRDQRRRSLLCFVHLTDQHIIDVQSPARVEFTDRFVNDACPPPFESAHRPQEAASARIADAMIRRIREMGSSPVTGAPIAAAVCTGDNIDNQQANETDVFLAVMDGGTVTPNSGDPSRYEGVQASGDLQYWHPDPAIQDRYKTTYGFPDAPGFLTDALASFTAPGIGLPWYSAYGNHDGLLQGNAPTNPALEGIATGPLKVLSPGPGNPCLLADGEVPIAPVGAPATPVTADPERRIIDRAEYARKHMESPGLPTGHGFTQANVDNGIVYYAADVGPLRFIVLDTVNPGGFSEGSVGDTQLTWLDAELQACDDNQRLAILFSHHGLRSLTNPIVTPDPADPQGGDLPRHLADDVQAVCTAHPSLILWVNGHTHSNTVGFRGEGTGAFWDVGTAAHIDWPAQARVIEVVDNADGTLSIFTTMIDHDDRDPTVVLARELMGNDPQGGFAGTGPGEFNDRNNELLIANPFSATGPAPTPTPTATPTPTPTPTSQTGTGSSTTNSGSTGQRLPATGPASPNLTIGGALLLAGAAGLRAVRAPRRS